MSDSIPLSQRISSLIKVGTLPASIISIIGDIFTPKNGELFVLILGFLSIFLCLYLLFSMFACSKPWWFKFFTKDGELNWIWIGKNPLFTHGIQSIFIFSIICLISGFTSFKHKENNGYLSNKYEIIQVIQSNFGILKENLEVQKEQLVQQKQINKKIDNLKKEISENPRKELVNLGVSWNKSNYIEAIITDDYNVVDLFIKGGMSITEEEMRHILRNKPKMVIDTIVKNKLILGELQCNKFIMITANFIAERMNELTKQDRDYYINFIFDLCKSKESSLFVDDKFSQEKKDFFLKNRSYENWNKHGREDYFKCMEKNNIEYINRKLEDYNGSKHTYKLTLNNFESLLEKVRMEYFYYTDEDSFMKNIKSLISEYCNKETTVSKPDPVFLETWELFYKKFN